MRLVHRSFCLTPRLLERLDAEAARRNVSTAAVLRWAANLGLRQLEAPSPCFPNDDEGGG